MHCSRFLFFFNCIKKKAMPEDVRKDGHGCHLMMASVS